MSGSVRGASIALAGSAATRSARLCAKAPFHKSFSGRPERPACEPGHSQQVYRELAHSLDCVQLRTIGPQTASSSAFPH
eukprot:933965-Alexandrium_andersonii.AAC.1